MKKLLLGCLSLSGLWGAAALSTALAAAPTLDLTPHTVEGPRGTTRTVFKGADGKYTINIGSNAQLTGSPAEATLRLTTLREATVAIKLSSLSPSAPFDEETLPAYRTAARAFAPPGIEAAPEIEEIAAPLPINDWSSHRIIHTYKLPGSSIRQSVTFLNISTEQQLVIVVTAFEDEFSAAAKHADAVLHSWRMITDKELSSPIDS